MTSRRASCAAKEIIMEEAITNQTRRGYTGRAISGVAALLAFACGDATVDKHKAPLEGAAGEATSDQGGAPVAAAGDEAAARKQGSARFSLRIENVGKAYPFLKSGSFTTPEGATAPGPLMPGQSYEVTFTAPKGKHLSFATMFAESNDFFYAPDERGIPLYDALGAPTVGDVTRYVKLWNAGTEIDQEPGVGPDQAPRQPAPNTGAIDPNRAVRLVDGVFATGQGACSAPAASDVIRVELTAGAQSQFTLRIRNVSTKAALMTSTGESKAVPLSPGVWVVHEAPAPLFSAGQPDRGVGLERIAEDGDPMMLTSWLAVRTGITVPVSPGVYAVAPASKEPIFSDGAPDRGKGLEGIAEDGDPKALAASLAKEKLATGGAFDTPVGKSKPGPAMPGEAYVVSFRAKPGDALSFATMYGPSNDAFFAPAPSGIPLFDEMGKPMHCDLTSYVVLWDAGTEANEEPGVGPHQPPQQRHPNDGPPDPVDQVRTIEQADDYDYGAVPSLVRVTIEHAGP
jgi:hypothetical protein